MSSFRKLSKRVCVCLPAAHDSSTGSCPPQRRLVSVLPPQQCVHHAAPIQRKLQSWHRTEMQPSVWVEIHTHLKSRVNYIWVTFLCTQTSWAPRPVLWPPHHLRYVSVHSRPSVHPSFPPQTPDYPVIQETNPIQIRWMPHVDLKDT